MNIDEAILILRNYLVGDEPDEYIDTADAIKLGIEALKSIMLLRSFTPGFPHALLLGETEE